ncbi:hypothetical protein AAY473_002270 [Plecturocebus cupreus]
MVFPFRELRTNQKPPVGLRTQDKVVRRRTSNCLETQKEVDTKSSAEQDRSSPQIHELVKPSPLRISQALWEAEAGKSQGQEFKTSLANMAAGLIGQEAIPRSKWGLRSIHLSFLLTLRGDRMTKLHKLHKESQDAVPSAILLRGQPAHGRGERLLAFRGCGMLLSGDGTRAAVHFRGGGPARPRGGAKTAEGQVRSEDGTGRSTGPGVRHGGGPQAS